MVARYFYDSWGKLLKVTDASGVEQTASAFIGNINPFRYRGYYYDVESGLYYLQSRYYDPEIGRFVNADGVFDLTNLYAYCSNDPVNFSDPTGMCKDDYSYALGPGYGLRKCPGYIGPGTYAYGFGSSGKTIGTYGSSSSYSPNKSSSSSVSSAVSKVGSAADTAVGTTGYILDNTKTTTNWTVNSKGVSHPTPWTNTVHKYPGALKAVNRASWAITAATTAWDVGVIWTEDSGNTTGQRWAKTGISVAGTAASIGVGYGAAAAAGAVVGAVALVAGGWIPLLVGGVVYLGISYLGNYAIDQGKNYAYSQLGIN